MPVTTQTPRLTNLTYDDLRAWTNLVGGDVDKYINSINSAGYDVSEIQAVEDLASGYMDFYQNGDGTYTVTQFKDAYQNVTTNPLDSNVSTTARGGISQMLNRGKDAITGKLQISKFPINGSFASQASYVVGSVGGAIGAVSVGTALGKTISPLLYKAAPNFWESIGVSEGSFNPENWKSITNGDDSNFAGLFNLILGIDPVTGNTQAYMDENAFAYMAYALAQNGFFNPNTYDSVDVTSTFPSNPIHELIAANPAAYNRTAVGYSFFGYFDCSDGYRVMFRQNGVNYGVPIARSGTATMHEYEVRTSGNVGEVTRDRYSDFSNDYSYTYNNKTMKYGGIGVNSGTFNTINDATNISIDIRDTNFLQALWAMLYGDVTIHGGIEGVGDQPNATLPDTSNWDSLEDVLPSLQQQYPDMFSNPLVWDNVQPDGTNPQLRYIPVPMPNATSGTDTQPTTGTQTQTQTVVNPDTSPETLLKLITELATKTQTDTDTSIPPQNPVDTGTGDTTPPALPAGNASALWSVYHPSQAQVNQFGAWLWTGNIITQIQQLLQNPMEGIITLHKVFAPPVDSGNGTIVVGRLDSEVPSATVNQQYVTVDCGSIDCYEQFGNVFDYSPFTNVSLYLPFIGIVPLNVDDIMRSSIHITYGVDVFTGACLAMVEVSRDGNTVNLYQYAGVASVEYPLTGSVHSGLITGLLGVAGSIAATVATGGVTAPAAIAAVGGVASAGKSQNARAGGFSGNAGAMGIKIPYLIIERPQTKVADTFAELSGYPTNYSCRLGECSGHVTVKHAHIHGMNVTESELNQIETLLKSGVIV